LFGPASARLEKSAIMAMRRRVSFILVCLLVLWMGAAEDF
jgi:hypothetical protein